MQGDVRTGIAEAIGTAILVIGGPGTAIFATGGFNEGLSVGILGVALAFAAIGVPRTIRPTRQLTRYEVTA